MPESETVALDLTCAECGRSPRAGEVWRIYFADRIAREAVTYCPQCAEREFGEGEDGRTIMETIGAERDGVTEKQAQAELRERLVRVERKGYRRPRKLTFRTYAETWFTEGQTRRRWKASTVKEYRSVRRRLVERFGPMPLEAVRPRHVAEYVADLSTQYGAATVSRDVSILHAIFATAKREELVEANPAERAERPKLPQRRWRILEPSEVASVAQAFTDEQARVVFLTLVLTGVRRSELQALRWSDVDLLEGVLRVRDSKTEEGVRSIALPSRLQGELAEHYRRSVFKGADELVFCHHERGTVYSAGRFREALEPALAAAGVEGHVRPFHDLRHSAITHDAASGSSAIAVMAKAGHRNMATTRTYLHLAGVVFRDEAERLESRLLGPAETVESSTALAESDLISDDLNGSGTPVLSEATD